MRSREPNIGRALRIVSRMCSINFPCFRAYDLFAGQLIGRLLQDFLSNLSDLHPHLVYLIQIYFETRFCISRRS